MSVGHAGVWILIGQRAFSYFLWQDKTVNAVSLYYFLVCFYSNGIAQHTITFPYHFFYYHLMFFFIITQIKYVKRFGVLSQNIQISLGILILSHNSTWFILRISLDMTTCFFISLFYTVRSPLQSFQNSLTAWLQYLLFACYSIVSNGYTELFPSIKKLRFMWSSYQYGRWQRTDKFRWWVL